MFNRTKLLDIDLSSPISTIQGLDEYQALKALIRLHDAPIGYIQLPVINGCCTAKTLSQAILEQLNWQIIRCLLLNELATLPKTNGLCITELFNLPPSFYKGSLPLVTVAVCTRDRTANLALCLDALNRLDYPNLDILVVDNAPSNDATECLVKEYPNVRYICEPRPGLDWARNRAIIEARGEIIAYTDDDVVVDSGWVRAIATVFAENLEVMAVTGLVVPYELETEAQHLFELNGGFGRGFERKWFRVGQDCEMPWQYLGTGQCGTGANMAYRRSVFDEIGYFDPALDVGTVTNGGGDLEMFFRVIKEGHTLVYEPSAIVRHRHRQEYSQLQTQIANNGIGFCSYLVRCALNYPDVRLACLKMGLSWLWWHMRRLLHSFVRPTRLPRDLFLAEFKGLFSGLSRYHQALHAAGQIEDRFGTLTPTVVPKQKLARQQVIRKRQQPVAIRTVELSQPLCALNDVVDYTSVRVFVNWYDRPLGSVNITNYRQPINVNRLREAIVDNLGLKLLEPNKNLSIDNLRVSALADLTEHYKPMEDEVTADVRASLPADVSVSVVVATYDRPDDLCTCLRYLVAQESPRQVEIIIVDNNPASSLTPPVVTKFPNVVLVSEPRQGLAYARNAGFLASKGEIVIATDDDVKVPPDWLEKLIAPFIRDDVMVVTGNTLPMELETAPQQLFEEYGGLGRGFERTEVNGERFYSGSWRHAVRTWELGATANAAFRSNIFTHPQIGLMDEALGPGMPSGVGEDTYLFYKVLKAGYTIVYEPAAYVWHKHRRDMAALRRQLYNYSKGHVAYHLTTLIRDRDFRALVHILVYLPRSYMQRIQAWLRGKSDYPLSLILTEIAGNLAGPWSLWRSHLRVKREGRSKPGIPLSQRLATNQEQALFEAKV